MRLLHKLQSSLEWIATPSNFLVLACCAAPILLTFIYIDTYAIEVPFDDAWRTLSPIAFDVKNGSLSLTTFLEIKANSRAAFTYALTAILAKLTNWDIRLEIYISLMLSVLRLPLLALLLKKHLGQSHPLALIAASFLIFSLSQYHVWLGGVYSAWHFSALFSMGAIFVLGYFKPSWYALAAAALLSIAASFSLGSGVAIFPVVTITLWMFGYRHWSFYAFWIGITALILITGYSETQAQAPSNQAAATSQSLWDQIDFIVRFTLTWLGGPLTIAFNGNLALLMGLVGLGFTSLNAAYVFFRQQNRLNLAPWLTLSGIAMVNALTVYLKYRQSIVLGQALRERYILLANSLWIALIALIVLVFLTIKAKPVPQWYERVLLAANAVLVVFLVGLYLPANIWVIQRTALDVGTYLTVKDRRVEDCVYNFPLRRDFGCLQAIKQYQAPRTSDYYKLAYYGLSVYRRQQAINVLPPAYTAGQPIILDMPSPWMNAYLRRWYLDGIQERLLFHVAPSEDTLHEEYISRLREPLEKRVYDYSGDTAAQLAAFLGDAPTVWYILTPETQPNQVFAEKILAELGYLPTVYPSNDTRFNSALTIIRYERFPAAFETVYRFGENISLQAWAWRKPFEDLQGCQTQVITLHTWWTTAQTPSSIYALRLEILSEAGTQIAQSTSGLTPVPTPFWIPEQFLLDERSVAMPCDLPRSDYQVVLSVIDDGTSQSLPVFSNSGVPIEKAVLETLRAQ